MGSPVGSRGRGDIIGAARQTCWAVLTAPQQSDSGTCGSQSFRCAVVHPGKPPALVRKLLVFSVKFAWPCHGEMRGAAHGVPAQPPSPAGWLWGQRWTPCTAPLSLVLRTRRGMPPPSPASESRFRPNCAEVLWRSVRRAAQQREAWALSPPPQFYEVLKLHKIPLQKFFLSSETGCTFNTNPSPLQEPEYFGSMGRFYGEFV